MFRPRTASKPWEGRSLSQSAAGNGRARAGVGGREVGARGEYERGRGGVGGENPLSKRSSTRSVPYTMQSLSEICVACPLTKAAVPKQFWPSVATMTFEEKTLSWPPSVCVCAGV